MPYIDGVYVLIAILGAFFMGAVVQPVSTVLPCVKCPTPPPPVICRACEVCTASTGDVWLTILIMSILVIVVTVITCACFGGAIKDAVREAVKYTPAERALAERCNATYEQARFVLPLLKSGKDKEIGPTNFKFIYNDAKLKADQKCVREMLCLGVKEESVVQS